MEWLPEKAWHSHNVAAGSIEIESSNPIVVGEEARITKNWPDFFVILECIRGDWPRFLQMGHETNAMMWPHFLLILAFLSALVN